MKKYLITGLVSLLSLPSFANGLTGVTVTENMRASAKIEPSCVFTVQNVEFGEYNPNNPEYIHREMKSSVKCSKNLAYKYYTTGGQYVKTPIFASYMTNDVNADKLLFQVQTNNGSWQDDMYQPAPQLVNNGLLSAIGTGDWQEHSINYRLVPNQYVSKGNYSVNHSFQVFF